MTKHQQRIEETNKLVKALRYNYKTLSERPSFRMKVKHPDKELERYEQRVAKLSLPQRFGMYKTKVQQAEDAPKEKLETPPTEAANEEKIAEKNPNHKVRSIF